MNNIKELFDTFDLYPSCVAFDGNDVIFNDKSLMCYTYMLNIVNVKKNNKLFE